MSTFDLDAYLARIGWRGSLEPTLRHVDRPDTCAHHTHSVRERRCAARPRHPHRPRQHRRRRWWWPGVAATASSTERCFRQCSNSLASRSVAHAARVVVIVPRHQSPRTHMFLTVEVDGERFVVDPGFGGHTALVPVPLREGAEVRDGRDRHRMVRHAGRMGARGGGRRHDDRAVDRHAGTAAARRLSAGESLGVYGGGVAVRQPVDAARADAGRTHVGHESRRDRPERVGRPRNISWRIARRCGRCSTRISGSICQMSSN